MARYRLPSGEEPIDQALQELSVLENRVRVLEGRRLSTWDRGFHGDVAAPAEGQHIVEADTEDVWFYSNGEWRQLGGNNVPWCRRERTTNLSVSSGTNDTLLAWETTDNNNSSTFSTPDSNTIRVLKAGVYCLRAEIQWNASKVEGSVVTFNSALGFTWNKGFYDEQNAGHTIEHNEPPTLIRRIPANTSLRVYVVHFAGVSRTIETAWFEVMKLGTYTGNDPND